MKKVLYSLLVLSFSLILISCGKKEHYVVVSKVISSNRAANNVIELYNNSDKDVLLNKYSIDIYDKGTDSVKETINLTGVIKANDYYVIGSKSFNSSSYTGVSDKFDLTIEKSMPIRGSDAITLKVGKTVIDKLGYTDGIDINYNKNMTLIRLGKKEDYVASATFDQFNFINYNPNVFEYLKNDDHKIQTLEDLAKGPKLLDEFKELKYTIDGQTGTGGAPIATLVSVADGDTATFDFEDKVSEKSHRYYYIDTPETAGPNTSHEPWGNVASLYNKKFLLNDVENKELRIQSVPNTGLIDTYDRNLGLVWINGQLSQFLIVREGLSKVDSSFNDVDFILHSDNVPYLTFLLFAQNRAKINGWGIHGFPTNPTGEKAPDWDYGAGKKADDSAFTDWKPHLNIIW